MKIKDEHINVKNINRIKKGSYEHTRSKDGYMTGSSTIYSIYADFGNGYEEIKYYYHQNQRDEFYNQLIRSIEETTVQEKFRYYEDGKVLLVVEKETKNKEFKSFIGTLFWISDGKIEDDGLHEIKEYKNKGAIDFTPLKR